MELGIRGRRALIFGGSRGVGRAVAGALAAEGIHVAVCARKGWAARRVAAEATASGGVEAAGYPLDDRDGPAAIALTRRIIDDFGAIDMLFGIARRPKTQYASVLSWEAYLNTGFLRFQAVTETLLPAMRERRWGRMLWMIPWPVPAGGPERHRDAVAGAALGAWLGSVAPDMSRDNVTLNLLKPAPVRAAAEPPAPTRREPETDGGTATASATSPSAADVAAVAVFLLSDPGGALTGRTIEVGGAGHDRAAGWPRLEKAGADPPQ